MEADLSKNGHFSSSSFANQHAMGTEKMLFHFSCQIWLEKWPYFPS
jgi:hypothetical protein